MRFILKNYLLLLACIMLVNVQSLFAAKDKNISSLTGSQIVALPGGSTSPFSLEVEDQKRAFMISNTSWACNFGIKRSEVSVMLRYDDSKRNFASTDWALNVTYDINLYNTSSTPYATFTGEVASINCNKNANANYTDVYLKTYEGALRAEVIVTNVAWVPSSGSTLSAPPSMYDNDVFFDLMQETERYYNFTFNGNNCTPATLVAPTVISPVTTPDVYQSTLATSKNELSIAWNFIEGAESYDVEWLFIDVPEASLFTSTVYNVDFSKATRVNTNQQHYEIPMAYPMGILVYRVRGVGIDYVEPFLNRTEGAWSVTGTNTSNLTAASGVSYIKYYYGLDKDYNWQYSAAYAEEGKRKEVISYFDGSLRNRQSVTAINSDNNAVVAETKYDFQGRGTVNVLPTPLANTGIHYYSNFNQNFDKYDFDVDGNFPASLPTIAELDPGATNPDQTAVYYGHNASATGLDKYVPDAQGDAYTQTVYKKDGTGRVSAASGVGPDHKIGSTHETRYYYGSPTGQEELDRLFGSEAGNVSHYKKNLVIDGNGQGSVTYLDQEGRVIASALTGLRPDNLMEIDHKAATEEVTVDMLTGKNHPFGDGRSSVTAISVSVPSQTYSFDYIVNWDTACVAPPCMVCDSCVYDITISVLNEERTFLGSVAGVTPSSLNLYSHNSLAYDISNGPIVKAKGIRSGRFKFDVVFPEVGIYYIEKSSELNQEAITRYMDDYKVDLQTAPCGPLPVVEPHCEDDDCNTLCNQTYGVVPVSTPYSSSNVIHTTKTGRPIDPEDGAIYDDAKAEYDQCVYKCQNIGVVLGLDQCAQSLLAMVKDMSPGGQYFDNKMDVIGVMPDSPLGSGIYPACSPNNYPGSYTPSNCQDNWLLNNLSSSGSFWTDFRAFIVDPSSTCATATFASAVPATLDWPWIRANWKTCFADFLVKYHPEYCAYTYYCDRSRPVCFNPGEACNYNTLGQSKDFDLAMKTDNMSGGSSANGYFNPMTGLSGSTTSALTAGYPVTSGAGLYISNLDNTSPAYGTSQTDPYFSCGDQVIYCKSEPSSTNSFSATDLMEDYLTKFHPAYDCPSCYPSVGPPIITPITSSTPRYELSIWYVLDDPHDIANNGASALSSYGITLDPATVNFFEKIHGNSTVVGLLNNPAEPTTKYELFKTWYKGRKDFLFYAGQYSYNCDNKKPFAAGCNALPVSHIEDVVYNPLTEDAVQSGYTPLSTTPPVNNTLPYAQIRFPQNPVFEIMLADCPTFDPATLATALTAYNDANIASTCQSNCEGYAENWMNEIVAKIKKCYDPESIPTIPASLLANIKADLISICVGSCDGEHPEGEDQVSTPVTASDGSSASLSSFDDVYEHYLGSSSTYGFCTNLIPSININHPPRPFSLAGCTCENLKEFAINNGIVCVGNTDFNQQLADKINEVFDLDPPYVTDSDVGLWMANCFVSSETACWEPQASPSMTPFLTPGHPYHPIPEQMLCVDVEAEGEEPDPCAQATADAAYQTSVAQSQYIEQKTAAYRAHFKQKCIDALLVNESLYSTYTLNEYYYTLYYYDQAGNLVKTVPPAGVRPLAVSQTAATTVPLNTKNVALNRATPTSGTTPFVWPYHTMVTNYKYNTLNQVRQQETPDAGISTFYYDRVGRLVVSQNAKQQTYASGRGYSYTVYDDLSRITEVGEVLADISAGTVTEETVKDPAALQTWLNNALNVKRQITRTYYDEAPYEILAGNKAYIQSPKTKGIYAGNMLGYLRNRVSCVSYIEADFDHSVAYSAATRYYDNASHYSYDLHGNVKTLYQENTELSDFDYDLNRIDYNYDLISGKVNEVHYNSGKVDQLHHRYEYDADNRLTAAYTSRNNVLWEKEAKYFYYQHGPLARTELGDKQVQATDYAYTLQGWIKGVNSSSLERVNDIGLDGYVPGSGANLNSVFGKDVHGYSLGYYNTDYTAKAGNSNVSFLAANTLGFVGLLSVPQADDIYSGSYVRPYKPLYNGNISSMATSIYHGSSRASLTVNPVFKIFRYDQLNRIMRAYSHRDFSSNAWQSGTDGFSAGQFRESFQYDLNGNIEHLTRYDGSGTLFDDIEYHYNSKALSGLYSGTSGNYLPNNKLNYIKDYDVTTTGSDIKDQAGYQTYPSYPTLPTDDADTYSGLNYNYDKIGNLTKDQAEQIGDISWTVYGKIKSITRSSGSTKADLEFVYDATGNRIEKIVKPRPGGILSASTDWTRTFYVRDAQGNVMATYKQENVSGSQQLKLQDQSIYGSSRLGMLQNEQRVDNGEGTLNQSSFGSSTNGWAGALGATTSIDAGSKRLKVAIAANSPGAAAELTPVVTMTGKTYEVTFDIDLQEAGNNQVYAEAEDMPVVGTYNILTLLKPVQGTNSFRFTARQGTTFIRFRNFMITHSGYNFYVDNITIKEIDKERSLGEKAYELSNHLGNVQTVIADRKTEVLNGAGTAVDYYLPYINSATDYYAFGNPMPDWQFNPGGYKYGFNGKENDPETVDPGEGTQDYGMRIYNPGLGRFLSVDPLAKSYPSFSPYPFAMNRPIDGIDLDGCEWEPTKDKEGNIVDYTWQGYNDDGSAKAGTVANATLSNGDVTLTYGSNAEKQMGYLRVNGKMESRFDFRPFMTDVDKTITFSNDNAVVGKTGSSKYLEEIEGDYEGASGGELMSLAKPKDNWTASGRMESVYPETFFIPVERVFFLGAKTLAASRLFSPAIRSLGAASRGFTKNLPKWPWKYSPTIEELRWGDCAKDATKIQKITGGEIVEVANRSGNYLLGGGVNYNGKVFADWFDHKVVKVGNKIFDKMTGPEGMDMEDYKNFFVYPSEIIFK